ncbi:MAG TPA: YbfB/YjiJ family MFS transporter [Burkholderiaceae bacterium]
MPLSSASNRSRADAAGPATARANSRWTIALAGAVSLAVAMGIGRFAFTPLLPMMLADGVVDLHAASWLASANYLGYLAGALLCTFQPWIWARMAWLPAIHAPGMVRGGLVATALLTLAMALPWPATWPVWRFAAGVASAIVFVYTSGWCLAQLARLRASATGGAIYTGPGAGIVISGLAVGPMIAWHWSAATGWLIFGALSFGLTATVWHTFRRTPEDGSSGTPPAATGAAGSQPAAQPHGRAEIGALAFAYGLAGFGYIITATFLPVIARGALPGSPWLDFFWPIFGLGVVVGALLATRLRVSGDLRRLLALAYLMQAAGIAASLWSPTLAGFAIGSLLLGLPFTAITFFAMQEVRRLRPASAASTMGLLTAIYGVGQIVGPPLAALMLHWTGSERSGFTLSLEIAGSALVLGLAIYLWMTRAFPHRPAAPPKA